MGRDAWRRLQAQTNMQSNRQQAGANFASDPLLLAMHLGDEYTRESRRADEAAENVARQPAAPPVRWESFRWLDATNGLVLIADLPQDVTSCNLDVQTLSLTSPSSMSLTLTLLETKTAGAWIKSRMATPIKPRTAGGANAPSCRSTTALLPAMLYTKQTEAAELATSTAASCTRTFKLSSDVVTTESRSERTWSSTPSHRASVSSRTASLR